METAGLNVLALLADGVAGAVQEIPSLDGLADAGAGLLSRAAVNEDIKTLSDNPDDAAAILSKMIDRRNAAITTANDLLGQDRSTVVNWRRANHLGVQFGQYLDSFTQLRRRPGELADRHRVLLLRRVGPQVLQMPEKGSVHVNASFEVLPSTAAAECCT